MTEYKIMEDNEKVYKKGLSPMFLAMPVEGTIEDFPQGQITCEEFLNY